MTLLRTEMEDMAQTLRHAEREAGCVWYGVGQFGVADYWSQPRVFEKLAGGLVRNAGEGLRCVFGARVFVKEDEVGTMIRPPLGESDGDTEALWLLAIDLSEGVEIGVVQHTPNGWGALRICADQVQLTPEAPGYWLMQEMLREGS